MNIEPIRIVDYFILLEMSNALYDLVLLWAPEESDVEHVELRKLLDTVYEKQFLVHSFVNTDEAIKFMQSNSKPVRPMIVITKLGTQGDNLGQKLIEAIRAHDNRTFIILHSHTACADPMHR